jgi:hypothetical protein
MSNIRNNERGTTPEHLLQRVDAGMLQSNPNNLKSYIDGLKKVTSQKQKSRVPQKSNSFLKSQQAAVTTYG